MATINTIQDLIRLLRENEEWRNAVRRELLTEELLELPQRFAEYVAANDKRWDDLGEWRGGVDEWRGSIDEWRGEVDEWRGSIDEWRGDVDEWRGSIDEWRGDVDEWRGGVDRKLDSIQGEVSEVKEDVSSLRITVDSLRGTALEAKLTRKLPPLVSREFDVARIYPIWTPGAIAFGAHTQDFRDKMERAAEDGVISDDDEVQVSVTDLVMRSRRRSDRSTLWFAVEASGVINDDDITRARRSADIIAKVYKQDAVALVYGYRIHDHQRKLADELGVRVYLDPDRD